MLTFKEFIAERSNLVPKSACIKIATSSGLECYVTPHAKEQANSRNVTDETIQSLATKALDFCKAKPAEVGKSFEVLFYSSKLKQGMIASFRRDVAGNAADKTKYLFIVTILPHSKQHANQGTHKIVLKEQFQPVEDVVAIYESMGYTLPETVFVVD